MNEDIIKALLQLSDNALGDEVKIIIRNWNYNPSALQILEVLDKCVYGSLCNSFCINVFEILLDNKIKEENTTYDEVVKKAFWRNN